MNWVNRQMRPSPTAQDSCQGPPHADACQPHLRPHAPAENHQTRSIHSHCSHCGPPTCRVVQREGGGPSLRLLGPPGGRRGDGVNQLGQARPRLRPRAGAGGAAVVGGRCGGGGGGCPGGARGGACGGREERGWGRLKQMAQPSCGRGWTCWQRWPRGPGIRQGKAGRAPYSLFPLSCCPRCFAHHRLPPRGGLPTPEGPVSKLTSHAAAPWSHTPPPCSAHTG